MQGRILFFKNLILRGIPEGVGQQSPVSPAHKGFAEHALEASE